MALGLLSHLHNTAAKAVLQLLEAQQVPRSETAPAPGTQGNSSAHSNPICGWVMTNSSYRGQIFSHVKRGRCFSRLQNPKVCPSLYS